MALTLSQKVRMSIGGKAFRAYEVTHDGSTGSISASEFDLNHFDAAIAGAGSDAPDLTSGDGATITFTALSASATSMIWAFGF